MRDLKLKPEYSSSHALIIGINDYKHASPLNHAVEDATAIAAAIQKSFGFQSENVKLLLDTAATKANILSTYFGYEKTAEPDSRLLIFFAGHGITKAGRYRDAGFLVPCDGNDHDLSTLIGWEELTRNADLIPSKHVFFVMDACYGGLVFNRAIGAGGVRFLKDMLIRPARQALTAGKQDEAVSDGGGPRPMHSVFTGHFLNGLEGAARAPEGHLTASGIMSYVYKQVANDIHSEQTPHYGFLSGDGDFIFDAPQLETLAPSDTSESDTLVTVSALEIPEEEIAPSGPIAVAKQILSDPKRGIQLHDLVAKYTRKLILETSKEQFPVQNVSFSPEELARRLRAYENVTQDLRGILACIGYWGGEVHHPTLSKALARLTDNIELENGLTIWNNLRWYPVILLCYSSGIAAIANSRYENLYAIFNAAVTIRQKSPTSSQLAVVIADEISELERSEAFKRLPGHERFFVPRSEYLFKLLQPELDDDLFLGKEYEVVFDRFEMVLALFIAVGRKRLDRHLWGPVGRFGWKMSSRIRGTNPFTELLQEAEQSKENWPPFKAGLFGSDLELFMKTAADYEKLIGNLHWW